MIKNILGMLTLFIFLIVGTDAFAILGSDKQGARSPLQGNLNISLVKAEDVNGFCKLTFKLTNNTNFNISNFGFFKFEVEDESGDSIDFLNIFGIYFDRVRRGKKGTREELLKAKCADVKKFIIYEYEAKLGNMKIGKMNYNATKDNLEMTLFAKKHTKFDSAIDGISISVDYD